MNKEIEFNENKIKRYQSSILGDTRQAALYILVLEQRIDKALKKIDNIFNNGDEYTIIDDLLELDKILKGDSNEI